MLKNPKFRVKKIQKFCAKSNLPKKRRLCKMVLGTLVFRGTVDCTNNQIDSLPNVVSTKKSKPTVERLILKQNKINELPERQKVQNLFF